ncbi:MAG: hypothetical protein PHG20_04690 [Geobacteraceae bacterium]|nr:hypothetical protein [Geobacteraceae bacterium]
MSKLEAFLARAIPAHQLIASAHLGDRSGYVGASDIAGCQRKAVFGKLYPVTHDIKTLLKFSRGHAAQAMYADFFKAGGALFDEEVEVTHPLYPEIRCHIDFLFHGSRQSKRLHIVEMKSTGGIPSEPYGSWVEQLHIQMGLLKLNVDPDIEITGSILVVDLNTGEYREFNSYTSNDVLFTHLVEKGQHILAAMRGECEPTTEPGPLCGHCAHRAGCPSHDGTQPIPLEVLKSADAYERLQRQKDTIEAGMAVLRNDILDFTGTSQSFRGKEGELTIATTVTADSTMLDSKKVKADYPDVYKECSKPKKGSTKLEVKRIKPAVPVEDEKKAA